MEYSAGLKSYTNVKLNFEVLRFIPIDFILKNSVVPIDIVDGKVKIAMKDNSDYELISRIKLICKSEIEPVQMDEHKLKELISSASGLMEAELALEQLKQSLTNSINIPANKIDFSDEIQNAPAVRLMDYIISNAITAGASDVHLEPEEKYIRVRYRIDGTLIGIHELPLEVYSSLATRIKVLGKMDISERRAPQDGKWQFEHQGKPMDLRVSSLPTLYGEKFVIRILDKSLELCELDKIFSGEEEKTLINRILAHSYGMILVTGPTGSGKSTTLYAMLKRLNNMGINITTIEDPIEFTMKGINQVNVNVKSGINFASGLRSILRQDPDVIMIGEIRDEETASIAIRAAITGHLVLSTLHTNDAAGAINRLMDMGVERYLIEDALVAVLSQRLVKKLCNNCKKSYKPTRYERKLLDINDDMKLYKGEGCTLCHQSGYSGRISISEILYLENTEDNLTKNNKATTTLLENCKQLVKRGITTVDELIKISNGKFDSSGEVYEKVSV